MEGNNIVARNKRGGVFVINKTTGKVRGKVRDGSTITAPGNLVGSEKDRMIEIAKRKAISSGYRMDEMYVKSAVKKGAYWTVLLFPKSIYMRGGDLELLIDGKSGKIVKCYLGQ